MLDREITIKQYCFVIVVWKEIKKSYLKESRNLYKLTDEFTNNLG